MRIYFLIALMFVGMMGSTHAIFYDDLTSRDINDSQNIVTSGANVSIPASEPIILGGDIISPASGSNQSNDVMDLINDSIILSDNIEQDGTNSIQQLPELERDAEFLMSLRWIYDQGITKYQDPEQFMPDNYLSRVDASKMLSILSRKVFGLSKENNESCNYTDISGFDSTTKGQVKDACKLGIFKSATLFNPSQGITKAQLIVVLVRMFDNTMLDETVTPWYKNYAQRARTIGLISDISTTGMDDVISRMDVAKMLYKLRNIYLNKTPVTRAKNPLFIHIIDNDQNEASTSYKALIDVNMIRDDYMDTLEMKLDTVTYYFGKTKIYNYGATLSNFQVYGYIYASSESITPIGVGTWRVQQGVIQEGKLIIWGAPQTIYAVTPNEDASLYLITKSE